MSSIQLKGLDKLHDQLKELGNELGRKALAQAGRKAFKQVLDNAKALVPRDSGDLAESLRLAVVKPRNGGEAAVAVGIVIASSKTTAKGKLPPARRWHFVELGTIHMAAHPYLRPALDANASKVLDDLKVELAKSIAKIIKKRGS